MMLGSKGQIIYMEISKVYMMLCQMDTQMG